jgi:Holliday junction resolvase RusA-like endonuclease
VTTPQDLKNLYEEQTGLAWSSEEGVAWLNRNYEHLGIYTTTPVLDKSAHVTISGKAGWLSQQRYHVCHPDSVISVIPVRIRPESWQALEPVNKTAFKAALAHRFSERSHIERQEGRLCLTFLFVCSASRRERDVDNMTKLLMDSIKGHVMGDDKEVDHLNVVRLVYEGDEESSSFAFRSPILTTILTW